MGTQLMGGAAPPPAPPSAPPQMPTPPEGGGGDRGIMILVFVAIVLAVALAGALLALALLPPSERSTKSDGASRTRPTTTGDATGTVGANGPGGRAYPVSSGPIESPGPGDAVRSALTDAARDALGIEEQFYVLQLYVQGDAALAELQPVGSEVINAIAFREDGGWQTVWIGSVDYDGALGEVDDPDLGLSEELIGTMDWSPAPTSDEAGQAMIRMLIEGSGLAPSDFTADVLALCKGTDGGWWAWGWVNASDPTRESEQYFICRPKGLTEWQVVEVGTGLDVSAIEDDAPPNVIEQFNACDS